MSNIHILSKRSLSNLKAKAKKLAHQKAISQASALNIVAQDIGFSCWKDVTNTSKFESSGPIKLIFEATDKDLYQKFVDHNQSENKPTLADIRGKYSKLIVDEYTDLQKIGAIARNQGINPFKLKSTIHILLSANDDVYEILQSEWENLGFFHDQRFADGLQKTDPFFFHTDTYFSFRLLNFDSLSFSDVYEQLQNIHEKTGSIIPIATDYIWIDGAIEPVALEPDPDYPDDMLPMPQLPDEVWKWGY